MRSCVALLARHFSRWENDMSFFSGGSKVKDFILMTLGTLIMVVGIYFFKFPNNFSFGGVTGFAVVLAKYTGPYLSKGNITLILNMALLVLGLIYLGKSFAMKTVYCTILMSVAIQALEWWHPLDKPVTNQPVIELGYAVLLPAVGSAILFNIGASSGGTDVLALMIKKATGLDVGTGLMISDTILTLFTFVAYDMTTGLMSLMGLLLKSLVIDSVIESFNLCKYVNIICDNPEPVTEYIRSELNRSATVADALGAFSGNKKYMVLAVVTRRQAMMLKLYVRKVEPGAFMIVTNTSEIIGKGFKRL